MIQRPGRPSKVGGVLLGLSVGVAASWLAWVAVPSGGDGDVKSAAGEADVVCSADGVRSVAPSAVATEAGISLRVWSDADGIMMFATSGAGIPFDTLTIPLDRGVNVVALPFPPPEVSIGCFELPFDIGSIGDGSLHEMAVNDPASSWIEPDLQCAEPKRWADTQSAQMSDANQDGAITLREAGASELPWLRVDDDFRPAMYPDSGWVDAARVIRDGRAIALVWRVSNPEMPASDDFISLRVADCSQAVV